MLSYEEWLKKSEEFNKCVDQASDALNLYCTDDKKGAMGLIKDEFKFSEDYKSLKNAYNVAFSALRWFNSLKEYKKYQKRRVKEYRENRVKKVANNKL
jgi:cation transport regulator ChaB